jgi:acetyl esterase/lipase
VTRTAGGTVEAVSVSYGEHADQVLEVHAPTAEASGVLVVLLHGGFWGSSVDRSYLRPMAAGLAAAGHVVALAEYRRVGAGDGWPETFDDVAQAVDRAPELVAGLPGVPVGPLAVVLVGHSSGGHLAAWCAGRAALPPGSRWFPSGLPVAGAVCLSGAVDLRLAADLRLGDGAAARFLGGAPSDVPERYRQGDPALLPPVVPVVLLHPADDTVVPLAVAESYAAAAARAGVDVRLRVLPGGDHFLTTDPAGAAWSDVLAALDDVSR